MIAPTRGSAPLVPEVVNAPLVEDAASARNGPLAAASRPPRVQGPLRLVHEKFRSRDAMGPLPSVSESSQEAGSIMKDVQSSTEGGT
jgi:hypothetical protein